MCGGESRHSSETGPLSELHGGKGVRLGVLDTLQPFVTAYSPHKGGGMRGEGAGATCRQGEPNSFLPRSSHRRRTTVCVALNRHSVQSSCNSANFRGLYLLRVKKHGKICFPTSGRQGKSVMLRFARVSKLSRKLA